MKLVGVVKFNISLETKKRFEIPQSFKDKLNELNLAIINNITMAKIETMEVFSFEAYTIESGKEKLIKLFAQSCKEKNIYSCVSNIQYEVEESTAMSDRNGHSKELVDKINYIWVRNSQSFKLILKTMYEKYAVEANDKGIEYSDEHFDDFVYNFLTNVCDDMDLEVIINFIRFREQVDNSHYRVLYSDGWINF